MKITTHFRHHWRFYIAFLGGGLTFMACWSFPILLVAALAGDIFFGTYLLLMGIVLARATSEDLKSRARIEDEGIALIVLITLLAIALGVTAMIMLLRRPDTPFLTFGIALLGVPLGWITLHVVAAFHYAHLYYVQRSHQDNPVLEFPGTPQPVPWDFLYFSFVIGMTAQVSDVQVCEPMLRRKVLAHGIVSFFYNTVLLALAVNLVAGHAR
ncbi:MAG TPA: DUF1345 domain-containing protein [Dongiaceae bacterium]|jgi:uncharacterized membrane protein|nr:DUF1345 domain-containing protein [Dongiaceae bacterium]